MNEVPEATTGTDRKQTSFETIIKIGVEQIDELSKINSKLHEICGKLGVAENLSESEGEDAEQKDISGSILPQIDKNQRIISDSLTAIGVKLMWLDSAI